MSITAVQNNVLNQIYQVQNTYRPQDIADMKSVLNSEIKTDCYSESERLEKFKSITEKYDVRNMSEKELSQMGKELYQEGFMSFKEMMIMTLPRSEFIRRLQQATGNQNISISGFKIPDPDAKIDYLDAWKEMQQFKEKHGISQQGRELDQKITSLLEKVDYFKKSS